MVGNIIFEAIKRAIESNNNKVNNDGKKGKPYIAGNAK